MLGGPAVALESGRLVCPSIRWRRGSFASESAKIRAALAAGVGGFILFGGTRSAVAALTTDIRTKAGRELLLGSDLERGAGQQIRGLTELPPPAALGFINDLDATARCGAISAIEARSVGINWIFAPVCDLDVEPKNPIVQTRSFGAEPARVGAHAAAWISACQNEGVLACAKHYPGHGRTTTDSHEGVPVVDTPVAEIQQHDVEPFKAAVQVGVASVMPAFVAYPQWDPTGAAAGFSQPILDYLRTTIGFGGLVVTDAFIMGGATAAAPETNASVAAVNAGCDMLLYPTDWAAVVKALQRAAPQRAAQALERYEAAVLAIASPKAMGPELLAEHQQFADGLADRALHLLRGEAPPLGKSLSVTIVDDDVGGPYAIPPRDVFVRELQGRGIGISRQPEPGTRHIVLVYAEPRSWKGRGDLGAKTLAQLDRLLPHASLLILFAHPRLVSQVSGEVPVLCAWHGQSLMQRAAARWVFARAT